MGNDSDDEDRRRQRREEEERERNRQEVMKRKRQWEVVDSDDAGGGDVPDRDSRRRPSRSRSRSRSEEVDDASRGGERRRRAKEKRRRRRERERSRSASSSRSRSHDRHKKDAGRKKDRRHRHRSKGRRKRHRKEGRRHKKKSLHRSGGRHRDGDRCGEASASYSSSSLSEDEREILERSSKRKDTGGVPSSVGGGSAFFGKYGIVNPSDLHSSKVKSSFERWLAEVKGIPSFTGPKHELMDYFGEYAEDYNTATLPHVKYYDYDKWEMEEYRRKKIEAERAAAGRDAAAAGGGGVALDELRHREEMAERARKKRLEEVRLVQYGMTAEKREEMKHQARLRHEMAVAYKTGDEETRRRLQKRLEPEEIAKR